jgi:hypothetical protein
METTKYLNYLVYDKATGNIAYKLQIEEGKNPDNLIASSQAVIVAPTDEVDLKVYKVNLTTLELELKPLEPKVISPQLAAYKAQSKINAINTEAEQNILAVANIHKQLNILARALMILAGKVNLNATEQAELANYRNTWLSIKAIRDKSNTDISLIR